MAMHISITAILEASTGPVLRPINAAADGRAANRRVEIVIEGARAPASEGTR
jgi:hypothetical protein